MKPQISIIVPVFNTVKYLEQCITSLKKINFKSFEVIFVDNCSDDGSYEILKKLDGKKFRVYQNYKNLGQSYSLNRGIRLSRAKFIAIMDSDDICLPNRLKDSYDFLQKNSNYFLVGGRSNTINEEGKILKIRRFSHDEEIIKARILIENPFSHTTVMLRKSIFKKIGNYSLKLKFAQDYDLFSRIILKNYKYKILNKDFTLVRKHKNQQSFRNKRKQILERFKISINNLKKLSKINRETVSFVKNIIFKFDNNFKKMSGRKKTYVIKSFLEKNFNNNQIKLYFCTLIFSRKNNFKKILIIEILIYYLILNKFLIFKKETLLRLLRSLFNIIL